MSYRIEILKNHVLVYDKKNGWYLGGFKRGGSKINTLTPEVMMDLRVIVALFG